MNENCKKSPKTKLSKILIIVLVLLLLISLGFNIFPALLNNISYLQKPYEIYIMEAGILKNNLSFEEGEDITISYDFTHGDYAQLISKYGIDTIAGEGTELERAMRLMDEYAPRLTHKSDYDNHIETRALPLLEYSLDKKSHGINCRNKAQILNEMCLALGIYSRKVWIMPNSPYDGDCHVVNEIWDISLNKWVMLDITNNQYWIDEFGTPLSVLEIREKGAMQEFCTPIQPGDNIDNPEKLKNKYAHNFIYIMKNMAYTEYLDYSGVSENANIWLLFPESLDTNYDRIISLESVIKSPIE